MPEMSLKTSTNSTCLSYIVSQYRYGAQLQFLDRDFRAWNYLHGRETRMENQITVEAYDHVIANRQPPLISSFWATLGRKLKKDEDSLLSISYAPCSVQLR